MMPMQQALRMEDDEFIAAVHDGIVEADAGRLIPYEDIRRWLLSWGSDNELLPLN